MDRVIVTPQIQGFMSVTTIASRALSAAMAVLCLSAGARAAVPSGPPVAAVKPVTDTYFGIKVVDPYRWMESEPEPEFRTYLEQQNAYARRILTGLPQRAAIAGELGEISGKITRVNQVALAGGRLFYMKRTPDAEVPRLYMRDGVTETMLVDPQTMAEPGKHAAMDYFAPSQDGTHVAYGVSLGGSEDDTMHVIETGTRHVLPDAIDRAESAMPSWAPDGRGFFYTRLAVQKPGAAPAEKYFHQHTYFHALGTDPASDVVLLDSDHLPFPYVAAQPYPSIVITPGSDYALAVISDSVSPEKAFYTAPVASLTGPNAPWRMVADSADGVSLAQVHGDRVFLLTHQGAPRERAVVEDLAHPGFATARTVVAQPPTGVLTSLAAGADALYVAERDGAVFHLSRLPYGATASEPIKLPFDGAISPPLEDAGDLIADPARPGAVLGLQSFVHAPVWLRYDPATRALADTGIAPPFPHDMSGYDVTETFATASDGTKIPLSIIAKRGTKPGGSHPALLEGYGSYGISLDSYFEPGLAPWLDRGGVFAVAHIRGGGELGQAWHDAGKIATKVNTITDFIACGEELVRRGLTTKAWLGGIGGSAGGITVGGAIVRRPDLFRAVVIQVGATDAARAEFTANGPSNIPEFGSVTNPAQVKPLLGMDAYLHVRDHTAYPAVLLTGGFDDPRVTVWEPAKMAARLQAASSSGRPVLLRIEFDAGHGIGSTRAQHDAEIADEFAFLLDQLKSASR